jgi:hypothetical protein
VLAFHGKNVPAITILSYLSRIHKYCPTTYEVFLSLLVYFDRMTERVNDLVTKSEEARRAQLETQQQQQQRRQQGVSASAGVERDADRDTVMRDHDDEEMEEEDNSSDATETDSELADSTDGDEGSEPQAARNAPAVAAMPANASAAGGAAGAGAGGAAAAQATYFVVDSFNIHRLIIAGVTCASKFFSDVFYTNSRYAKVCFRHLHFPYLVLMKNADMITVRSAACPSPS